MSDQAQELVRALEESGAWPDPELLDAIVALGEAAIEPLVELVGRETEIEEDSVPLECAVRILSILGPRPAVPALLALFRVFDDEILDAAADALARVGPEIIEPALTLVRDPSLNWYPRISAVTAARRAAGDDLVLRQGIAATLREILNETLMRAEEPDEETYMLASFLVENLAELADPLARDLIENAFQADLVDESVLNRGDVLELYEQGGQPADIPDPSHWLEGYRRDYVAHQEWENRVAPDDRLFLDVGDRPDAYEDFDSEERPHLPIETIRYTDHRPGRNDPCWCGSGKKYKKCHLTADESSSRNPK